MHNVTAPSLLDLEHIRFLVAVPMLTIAELIAVHRWLLLSDSRCPDATYERRPR
jgi:hypothetical protein